MMTRFDRAWWLAAVLSSIAQSALACGVCIERPEKTFSDLLLEADSVVLARENPAHPFQFGVTAVLAGSDHVGPAIPCLVDSVTRRRLAQNASNGVLIARQGSSWTRLGYADAALLEIVGQIMSHGPAWKAASADRFEFFDRLVHDPDPLLRHLAIDELSRATYDLLRAMDRPIDGIRARKSLADRAQQPWKQLFVLFLGLSDRSEDHELIRARVSRETRAGGSMELEAWATAFVEIDGAAAVGHLARVWFEPRHSETDALRAIVAALATHARFGEASLQPAIVATLAALVQQRPDFVGSVALAFDQIEDFSHGDVIMSAVTDLPLQQAGKIDPADLFAASAYVHRARFENLIDPSKVTDRKWKRNDQYPDG